MKHTHNLKNIAFKHIYEIVAQNFHQKKIIVSNVVRFRDFDRFNLG